MGKKPAWIALMILLSVSVYPAGSRTGDPSEPPALRAVRITSPITVDGVLNDAGWKGALEVSTFYEVEPGDCSPPAVKTTALLAYDDRALYVAFRCEDPDPSRIRAPYVDRDTVFGDQDFAGIFLDTRGDGRSALELFVNPRGIHDDGIMNDATGQEDFSPDLFWDSAARITETGWTMEMAVPFTSLRYGKKDPQRWGILFFRNYPRDFRYQIVSEPLPRGSNCVVCRAATLENLAGLPTSGHWVVAPYLSGRAVSETRNGPGTNWVNRPATFDGGLDVKWTPTADHAVDLTVNPDFSQVESDTAQISVNERFALFYPEKRPFFMEGTDLFQTPIRAVYTRTITAPRWGLRSTGRVGHTAYTALVAQDSGGGSVIIPGPQGSEFAPQDFRSTVAIFRLRKSMGASFAGFLVTATEGEGGSRNRVLGPDFQWNPNKNDRITGQFLFSTTRNPDRPDLSPYWNGESLSGGNGQLVWRHDSRTLGWELRYEDVSGDFRANNGFVPRVGYRRAWSNVFYSFYPEGFFRRIVPEFYLGKYWDRSGRRLATNFWPGIYVQAKGDFGGGIYYNRDTERVGDILLRTSSVYFEAHLSPSLRLSRIHLEGNVGERMDFANVKVARGGDVSLSFITRPTDHLSLEWTANRQWLDNRGNGEKGRLYTAWMGRGKAVYTFSARSFLRLIAQWTSVSRDPALYPYTVRSREGALSGSLLYAYRLNWQSVLFVGYGDDRVLSERNRLLKSGRQLFFKVSYAFQR